MLATSSILPSRKLTRDNLRGKVFALAYESCFPDSAVIGLLGESSSKAEELLERWKQRYKFLWQLPEINKCIPRRERVKSAHANAVFRETTGWSSSNVGRWDIVTKHCSDHLHLQEKGRQISSFSFTHRYAAATVMGDFGKGSRTPPPFFPCRKSKESATHTHTHK